jgi:uncharacterized membrane protein
MRSTARLMGHPIHPMLIPYPFAFLSGAAAFDLAGATRDDPALARTATHLRNAGLAAALVAAVPGLIDYLTVVPRGKPSQTATLHLVSNLSALACFAAAGLAAPRDGRASRGRLSWEVMGLSLLSVGGWLGGSLTYHHQVGVDPEEPRRRLPQSSESAR